MDGIGKGFIEKTKYHHLTPSDRMRGVPQPPLELEYDTSKPPIQLRMSDRVPLFYSIRFIIPGDTGSEVLCRWMILFRIG